VLGLGVHIKPGDLKGSQNEPVAVVNAFLLAMSGAC